MVFECDEEIQTLRTIRLCRSQSRCRIKNSPPHAGDLRYGLQASWLHDLKLLDSRLSGRAAQCPRAIEDISSTFFCVSYF
jgi:hypothetical protein